MSRRAGLLLGVFVLLAAAAAAFLYGDRLLRRIPGWIPAPPVEERPVPRERADEVLAAAADHFSRSLTRTLNLPAVYDNLGAARTLHYDGLLDARFGNEGPLPLPEGRIRVSMRAVHGIRGPRRGRVRGQIRREHGGGTVVLQYREDTVQLLFPRHRAYYESGLNPGFGADTGTDVGVPSWRRDTAVRTRWRGRPVVRHRWRRGSSRALTLYVSSGPPHAVVGSTYRSRERRVRHTVTYLDPERRRRFKRFETDLNGRRAARLAFTHRDTRVRRVQLETPGFEGMEWLRLDLTPGRRHTRGGTISIRSRWIGGTRRLGTFDWRFRDGLPTRFSVNLHPPRRDGGRGLRFRVQNLRWTREPPRVNLASGTSHRRLTRLQALGRVLEWIQAGGGTDGEARSTDGGRDQRPPASGDRIAPLR